MHPGSIATSSGLDGPVAKAVEGGGLRPIAC